MTTSMCTESVHRAQKVYKGCHNSRIGTKDEGISKDNILCTLFLRKYVQLLPVCLTNKIGLHPILYWKNNTFSETTIYSIDSASYVHFCHGCYPREAAKKITVRPLRGGGEGLATKKKDRFL